MAMSEETYPEFTSPQQGPSEVLAYLREQVRQANRRTVRGAQDELLEFEQRTQEWEGGKAFLYVGPHPDAEKEVGPEIPNPALGDC